MIERIDNPRDLLEYLQLYPAYPKLPRVLLFTAQNYVGPLYKALSQALYTDAVFGAVVAPFTTKDKAAVAEMYGVKKSDLPAIVVLYPQDRGDADEVKRVPNVSASSTLEDLTAALQPMLPDAYENQLVQAPPEEQENVQRIHGQRKSYIATEHDIKRSKLDAKRAQEEAPAPVVVNSQTAWKDLQMNLLGHQTFIAFVQPGEAAKTSEMLHSTTKRIFKELPSIAREGRLIFAIIEGTSHHEINKFFGVDVTQFPQLIFIDASTPKTKYYKHVAAFNEDRILHFYVTKGADALATGGKDFKLDDIPAFGGDVDIEDVGDL
ncbi:hypothetical protein STCU_05100 [Strigomonas culicis]|uniref:Thioredoxin domain-containing protein n=1 Tax=Strigomonas culicis TaxID=28005 RepID=S9VXW1_9TRYP|nr:hypothetical protein STCU_05100 [Strigomonas culicis]|eukprot:EPY28480.1 hypothetical protein STCU_05100 [Strigomonas culicis]